MKKKILEKFGKKEYQVDEEAFIMGVHHLLAERIARKFKDLNIVLDACCGAGFMSISLAKYADQVIAVDLNQKHLNQAKTNAKIAGVEAKIKFIAGDILSKKIINKIPKIDAAFLDPDWAKVGDYKKIHVSKLSEMEPPADKLFRGMIRLTPNIILKLPKEIDLKELKKLPSHKLEKVFLNKDFKFYCACFGDLIR